MKAKIAIALGLILLLTGNAMAGNLLKRAGQDLWYAWYDEKGERNGYHHEVFTKATSGGKLALKTVSTLFNKSSLSTNDFSLELTATELEPMVSFTLEGKEQGKEVKYESKLTGKPSALEYEFVLVHQGKSKTIKVPRAAFDYFDFEDNHLYDRVVPGKGREYRILNTFSLGIEKRTITYLEDETIEVEGKTYQCRKFTSVSQNMTATVWREISTDAIVKQVFDNGAKIIRTGREKATSMAK